MNSGGENEAVSREVSREDTDTQKVPKEGWTHLQPLARPPKVLHSSHDSRRTPQ